MGTWKAEAPVIRAGAGDEGRVGVRTPDMATGVAVDADLDSGALVVRVRRDDPPTDVRAALASCAAQRPEAVIVDLGPTPQRWTGLLYGLAGRCARHAVPLLVVPALVAPGPVPVRTMLTPAPVRVHATVADAIASLPHTLTPAAHHRRAHLPATPAAASLARHIATGALDAWGVPELTFAVELITSELVSNAVRHARTDLRLLVRLESGGVRVGVHDRSPAAPLPRHRPDSAEENGRGLLLVASAAAEWGYLRGSRDKVVWARVAPPIVER